MPTYVTQPTLRPCPISKTSASRRSSIVRWHRERHHPVAAQIRAVLPRFRDLTDRQILDGAFKLGDAQELVARQAGFESMAGAQDRSAGHDRYRPDRRFQPTLTSVEAELFVADIKASCAFFTDKLGFRSSSPTASRRSTAR